MDSLQALDYTSGVKSKAEAASEQPVLDLSFKKQLPSDLSSEYSNSPASSDKHTDAIFSDLERKSPFEGRTFMVTPPSESDSPKKSKYETIYNRGKSSGETAASCGLPMMPMSIPIPIVATALPTMMPQGSATGVFASDASAISSSVAAQDASKKVPRPFKAYPKDPLSLTVGPELMYDQNSNEAYSEFRKRMLDSVRRTNEGTNIKMRRVTKSPGLPTSTVDEKDAAYWERRRKNNEAAKRSRDARRAKEDEIAIRAAFLEQENIKLKYELVALRNETAKLRCMVYSN